MLFPRAPEFSFGYRSPILVSFASASRFTIIIRLMRRPHPRCDLRYLHPFWFAVYARRFTRDMTDNHILKRVLCFFARKVYVKQMRRDKR